MALSLALHCVTMARAMCAGGGVPHTLPLTTRPRPSPTPRLQILGPERALSAVEQSGNLLLARTHREAWAAWQEVLGVARATEVVTQSPYLLRTKGSTIRRAWEALVEEKGEEAARLRVESNVSVLRFTPKKTIRERQEIAEQQQRIRRAGRAVAKFSR